MSTEGEPRGRTGFIVRLVAAGALVVVLAAAGLVATSHRSATSDAAPPPTEAPTTTVAPLPASPVPVATTIATVTGPVPYSAEPGGLPVGTIPVGSWWGLTKQLPVLGDAPGWLHVRLPQRPNGLTGWIPASTAQLSTTTYGILIDVRLNRLKLYNGGQLVVDLPAGVGTEQDPTPLGDYYVMDVAPSEGPGWGPFILDTNAHSESITSWEGSGDAFTAIHGPLGLDAAIGTTGAKISHGCVRLHDADLAQLKPVPAGAPIVIVA